MENRLVFKDLLLIGEAVLGVPADELERTICVYSAEAALAAPFARFGATDLYPDPVEQAAICALWIVRSQPLPFGNKQIAYECMLEMLARGGHRWRPREDAEGIAATLKRLEAGAISEAGFLAWVRSQVARDT